MNFTTFLSRGFTLSYPPSLSRARFHAAAEITRYGAVVDLFFLFLSSLTCGEWAVARTELYNTLGFSIHIRANHVRRAGQINNGLRGADAATLLYGAGGDRGGRLHGAVAFSRWICMQRGAMLGLFCGIIFCTVGRYFYYRDFIARGIADDGADAAVMRYEVLRKY